MKTIFLFILFSCLAFGQVKFVSDELDSLDSDIFSMERNYQFLYITVDLPDSADSVIVWMGTNDPDSATATNEIYSRVVLQSATDGTEVTEITGDEIPHSYMVKWGYKRTNVKLESTAWSDTVAYYIEWY